jgi:hypothetical protein
MFLVAIPETTVRFRVHSKSESFAPLLCNTTTVASLSIRRVNIGEQAELLAKSKSIYDTTSVF